MAVAAPIPPDAPVTSTVLSSSRFVVNRDMVLVAWMKVRAKMGWRMDESGKKGKGSRRSMQVGRSASKRPPAEAETNAMVTRSPSKATFDHDGICGEGMSTYLWGMRRATIMEMECMI